jgi:hypothetical protein
MMVALLTAREHPGFAHCKAATVRSNEKTSVWKFIPRKLCVTPLDLAAYYDVLKAEATFADDGEFDMFEVALDWFSERKGEVRANGGK